MANSVISDISFDSDAPHLMFTTATGTSNGCNDNAWGDGNLNLVNLGGSAGVCLRLLAIMLLVILVLAARRWPLTYRKEGHRGDSLPLNVHSIKIKYSNT